MSRENLTEKQRLFLDLIDIVWEEIYAPRIAAEQAAKEAAAEDVAA